MKHIKINNTTCAVWVNTDSLEVHIVDVNDYPKFTDSYFSYGEWENGEEMTEDELDEYLKDNGDILIEKSLDKLRG